VTTGPCLKALHVADIGRGEKPVGMGVVEVPEGELKVAQNKVVVALERNCKGRACCDRRSDNNG
jgi:hypothetical protein